MLGGTRALNVGLVRSIVGGRFMEAVAFLNLSSYSLSRVCKLRRAGAMTARIQANTLKPETLKLYGYST